MEEFFLSIERLLMKNFFTFIGGVITITIIMFYFLAAIFAPFGIVWLVLVH